MFYHVSVLWYKHLGCWENTRNSWKSLAYFSCSPNTPRVYIREQTHGKRVLLLKYIYIYMYNWIRSFQPFDPSELHSHTYKQYKQTYKPGMSDTSHPYQQCEWTFLSWNVLHLVACFTLLWLNQFRLHYQQQDHVAKYCFWWPEVCSCIILLWVCLFLDRGLRSRWEQSV